VTNERKKVRRECRANCPVCLVSSKVVFKESKANWTALPYIVGGAFLKLHLWLIKFISVIVPRRLRADWRQEWEAELRYREALLSEWDNLNWKTKLDLLRRSLGAFRDALLLQPRRLEVDRWNIKTPTPGANGEPESVEGALVSGSYFSVLGVRPAVGRVFTMEDDRAPGGHPVAVISHRYWQRMWAGDPAAIGRTFTLNDTAFTIIGVAPPEFFGVSVGQAPDLWVPTMMKPHVYRF